MRPLCRSSAWKETADSSTSRAGDEEAVQTGARLHIRQTKSMETTHTQWSKLPGIRVVKTSTVGPFEAWQILKSGGAQVTLMLKPMGQIAIVGVELNAGDDVALALARLAYQHVRDSLAPTAQNLVFPVPDREVLLPGHGERRLFKFSELEGKNCTAHVFMIAGDITPPSSVRFSSCPPDELLIAVGRQLLAWHAPTNSKQGGPAV